MRATILAAASYIFVFVGVWLAGAIGIGGVGSLIWMSAVAILVVAGLFAGGRSLWAKEFARRGKDGGPNRSFYSVLRGDLIWALVAGAIILAAALNILMFVGVLVAGALGIGGVESLIWMSAVAILVVAGLFAGVRSLWAKEFARRGKDGGPNRSFYSVLRGI